MTPVLSAIRKRTVPLTERTADTYGRQRRIARLLRFNPKQFTLAAIYTANGFLIVALILGLGTTLGAILVPLALILNFLPILTLMYLRRTGYSSDADFSSHLAGGRER